MQQYLKFKQLGVERQVQLLLFMFHKTYIYISMLSYAENISRMMHKKQRFTFHCVLFLFVSFVMLGLELRASNMLGKCSII
jgi:hypothetical protein